MLTQIGRPKMLQINIWNSFLFGFLTSQRLAPALLIAWNSILLDGRAAVSTLAGASWALGRMWKRPKPIYDQACTAWSSTRGSWEHFDGTKIRFGSKQSLDGGFWCLSLGLMISDVFSLNFPGFCSWLSGPESVMLCSWDGEPGNWSWKSHWSFLTCRCCSLVPLFGKGASVPCLRQLGFCLPPAWSQPLEGWIGLSTSGTTGNGKRFSFPRRTCSDPPVTGDGFGHGVPFFCPQLTVLEGYNSDPGTSWSEQPRQGLFSQDNLLSGRRPGRCRWKVMSARCWRVLASTLQAESSAFYIPAASRRSCHAPPCAAHHRAADREHRVSCRSSAGHHTVTAGLHQPQTCLTW